MLVMNAWMKEHQKPLCSLHNNFMIMGVWKTERAFEGKVLD